MPREVVVVTAAGTNVVTCKEAVEEKRGFAWDPDV